MQEPKELLKNLHSDYQNLKAVGLDILKSIQRYFENTDNIQELSHSKVSLNFTLLDMPLTVMVEFPPGSLVNHSGVISTLYKSNGEDKHTPMEKQFTFDHLGNIEKTYTKDDFPSVYLQIVLDYIVHKIKIVPKP
jgi:hypothetical protein